MKDNSLDGLESLLEQSLPDLVRRESAQRWTQQWIGRQVDSYLVEELIGTGTHGVVFRARRTSPYERSVAIKLLPNLRGQAKAKRFQNECQALADLEHPSISQILTAGLTDDGTPYLVMPLLYGVPIDDYMEAHDEDWSRVADLVRQLADAVAFAHENGVVHCDLKPDNILVDEEGRVTVTDFGLAVRIDEMDDLALRPSWAPGTIGYAAPEILTSREDASPSVDIYSLGAVLYRLVTGQPPRQSSGWLDSLVATVEAEPRNARALNPSAPEALSAICDRCLAKAPASRFSSAAELACELVEFVDRSANSRGQRPLVNTILGLFLGLVILMLLLLFWSGKSSGLPSGVSSTQASPVPLSDEEAERILKRIEEKLLRPGLKDPTKPGDFEATFAILKDASEELKNLLARAPNNKMVRHRTATGYFLLGRAAHWMRESESADQSLALSEQMFRQLHRDYPDDGFMFDFFHTIFTQASRAAPRESRDLHLMALGVIEGLHESDPENLDYSDALACMLVLLADDYSREHHAGLFDLEKAESYARRANELAQWTCRQPGSLPMHRKHIMSSTSTMSEIARYHGELERSLELATVARAEAIRLDEAMQIADTKNHRFDKTYKLAIALMNVERLDEAAALTEVANELADQLRKVDWPTAHAQKQRLANLSESIRDLQESEPRGSGTVDREHSNGQLND